MKTVVISSSKRYKKEVHNLCQDLEKLGIVVFEPNFDQVVTESEEFGSRPITKSVFKGLTLEHFDWIRKAEVFYLYNKDNYVGVSVSMEMGYASALGKPIFALSAETGDPSRNSLIDKVAASPKELARLLV